MVWERYCNASPKPEFFLFSLFIFSFISQLIWVRLGWNFHRWFSIQKQVNWCTIDPFSLKFCTSQHSYPVPLTLLSIYRKLSDTFVMLEEVGMKFNTKSWLIMFVLAVACNIVSSTRYLKNKNYCLCFGSKSNNYISWIMCMLWNNKIKYFLLSELLNVFLKIDFLVSLCSKHCSIRITD